MKKLVALVLFSLAIITPVFAKTDMVIVSVNNKALTLQELKDRIELTSSLIGRKLSSLEQDIIKQKALEQIISEELIRQYSKQKHLTITDSEFKLAVEKIEEQRKMKPGNLMDKLPKNLKTTAKAQIQDSILQQKIIEKVIIPQVRINDQEVETLLQNSISQAQTKEYNLSRIRLPYNKKSKAVIGKIYAKLEDGESFQDVAIAFSEDNKNNNLGWFALEELNFKTQQNIKALKKGQYSKPFLDKEHWVIVKVNDIKITTDIDTSKTTLYKFITFKKNSSTKSELKEIKNQVEHIKGFSDFRKFIDFTAKKHEFTIHPSGWVKEQNLDSKISQIVKNTKPGSFSQIKLKDDDSVEFLYILDKQLQDSDKVAKMKLRIINNLKQKQIAVKFRTFMQKLKENAFIEIR
jgi:parvulin-like peptidyl-prolyl isomerase